MPSLNTILATAPNTTSGYILKATGTSIGNSLIYDNGTSVGIGVTPSAWSGFNALQVASLGLWSTTANNSHFSSNLYYDGSDRRYITSDYALEYNQQSGIHKWLYSVSGTSGNVITLIEAMRINTSGYIGINTTTTTSPLSIYGSGNMTSVLDISASTSTIKTHLGQFSNNTYLTNNWYFNGSQNNDSSSYGQSAIILDSTGFIELSTSAAGTSAPSSRMRVFNNGNMTIGTNVVDSGFKFYMRSTAGMYLETGSSSQNTSFQINDVSGNNIYLRVRGDGYLFSPPTYNNQWAGYSANMYIASDGSMGRTTPSSGRYKDNINDWNGKGLETILALKPKTFKYKKEYCETADIDFLGLIAEEVAEVSPYLAQYENPDRTGLVENVRYDTIVVPLIAAIQEQQEIINQLSAKVTALENK